MTTRSQYISVKEAAQLLEVTTRTVHKYRARGLIKAKKRPLLTVPRFRLLRISVLALAKQIH